MENVRKIWRFYQDSLSRREFRPSAAAARWPFKLPPIIMIITLKTTADFRATLLG